MGDGDSRWVLGSAKAVGRVYRLEGSKQRPLYTDCDGAVEPKRHSTSTYIKKNVFDYRGV